MFCLGVGVYVCHSVALYVGVFAYSSVWYFNCVSIRAMRMSPLMRIYIYIYVF